ncbi:Src-like protein [Apiospora rasikravindrae]|uniref:Src-like protein n=1 Tax=Apiospora rasikravindrae TaxID=990691 RepID=A0ABR1TE67_9PEZI
MLQKQQHYETSQFAAVPHDPYPMDGMTMLCRTDGPGSGMNSATSSNLSSRDEHSDYSNPTSLSSMEPPSGQVSPIKQPEQPAAIEDSPDKRVLKKKSGFFQNHSPFRRKSTKDMQAPTNRNTWGPVTTQNTQYNSAGSRRPQVYQQHERSMTSDRSFAPERSLVPERSLAPERNLASEREVSPDPIDANASLALNIGQNVFEVANSDRKKKQADQNATPAEELDPIALALAELKGVTGNKQSAGRMSADHYHGIATPAPGSERSQAFSRSVPAPRANTDVTAAKRGTPPPSYDQQVQRLGVPAAACTKKAMQATSRKYEQQTREMFTRPQPSSYNSAPVARPSTRGSEMPRPSTRGSEMPRAASPAVPRALSPGLGTRPEIAAAQVKPLAPSQPPPQAQPPAQPQAEPRQSYRAPSPNPYAASHQPQAQAEPRQSYQRSASPNPYAAAKQQPQAEPARQSYQRSASPNPYAAASHQAQPDPRSSYHAPSPAPYNSPRQPARSDSRMTTSETPRRGSDNPYYHQNSPSTQSVNRTASPATFRGGDYDRPSSGQMGGSQLGSQMGSDLSIQLAPLGGDDGYGSQRGRGGGGGSRPGTSQSGAVAFYDGRSMSQSRQRSKSVADPSRQYTREGRPILHFALYMYQAAIPEELGFSKGDYLAVLRHQDDGWWEAEIHSGNGAGRGGLVPSNYLQPC